MAAFPFLPLCLFATSMLVALIASASYRIRGGQTSAKNKPQQRASKLSEVERHLQYALERAAEAEAFATHAGNGDRNSRLANAECAQYQATAAREAADRASAAAYGGTTSESDYAGQARGAADRAQVSADRARYNASLAQ